MSMEQAAPDDGCWYMPHRTEQAHLKRIERWLHAHPLVKVTAEEFLQFICDTNDSLEEANYWVHETLWLLDYYLLVFPDKEIVDWHDAIYDGAMVAGKARRPDPTNPKLWTLPGRAEIEACVAKNGGIVPLPKKPPRRFAQVSY